MRKKKNLKFSQTIKTPKIFLQNLETITYSEVELKKWFSDILTAADFNAVNNPLDRKVTITRFCKTHGVVTDDGSPLMNYCSDPTCFNCNQFHELLAEEAKNFLK